MSKQPDPAKKLADLLKKLRPKQGVEAPPATDPLTQLVLAMLQWEATAEMAHAAMDKILPSVVDLNELRVSQNHEIMEIIGPDYPLAEQRILRMREALNEIFHREHGIEPRSVASKGKKEQRAYYDTLPGLPPYAIASIMLLSYGAHAMPVDDRLARLLAAEEIVAEEDSPEEIESFLTRQIKAGDAVEAHLLLQKWSDQQYGKPVASSTPRKKKAAKTSPRKKK
jgi:endonuclease III